MVRKRTRTSKPRRNSRKAYESDENDSDIDLDLDSPPSSPAPKRYGLRQRKQPVLFEDFDYEDDDEVAVQKRTSDDDDYQVEVDLQEGIATKHTVSRRPSREHNSLESSSCYKTESETDEISLENGLIDFEDVIRADVVVNKQRVDYDNLINKTEIQVVESLPAPPIKARRGRKPKPKPDPAEVKNEISSEEPLSPLNQVPAEDSGDQDNHTTNLEVQIDPSSLVQCDSDDNEPLSKLNGVISLDNNTHKALDKENSETVTENGVITPAPSWIDKIEKYVPPELDEKDKEVMLSNEYLLANTFDVGADEFLQKQEEKKDQVEEEEEHIPVMCFDDDDGDDSSDDVVIIEKKPEVVIILDDD
ncbi:uncharacterized protein LOC115874114 [Sitophilus oryzae]|uniref:Uncharacterized protein LOC115874114 n=1 Tax=Sitophilus oryzae TaxID=7048 RepID=A0A6J2X249_SITOR|nr:uncharacterized protein LOC115874114 [Sitophilus oryzae]